MLVKLLDFIPTSAFLICTFSFPAKVGIKSCIHFTSICIVPAVIVGNDYIRRLANTG